MKTQLSLVIAALVLCVPSARGQTSTSTPTPTPTPGPRLAPSPAASPAPKKGPSLADTVRRVRASATPVPKKKSLGVITNESLHKPEASAKGSVQVGPARPIGSLPAGSASEPDSSEGQWRSRANQARERVAAAQDEVKRLELENKRLENDFYAWSDGNYRDRVIKPAWDQAREDLKKARAELDAAQNAQADLEEEARKAGVPAGWLRER